MTSRTSPRVLAAFAVVCLLCAAKATAAGNAAFQAGYGPIGVSGNETDAAELLGLFKPGVPVRSVQNSPVSTRALSSRSATQVANSAGGTVSVRVFEVVVSGTTYWGDANFLENNPNFTPAEQFQLSGYFFLTDTFDRYGYSGNDVNPFDIGLAVLGGAGTDFVSLATSAGALDWASNSGVHGVISQLLDRGYAANSYDTGIDYCVVTQDQNGVYTFAMDTSSGITGSKQLLDVWNAFTVTSGSFAGAKADKPVAGGVQFAINSDNTVEGYLELYGAANPAEPFGGGTSAIAANFQGAEVQLT